ncbi:hypothetical protein, conserved [Eimeria praecox]|uniref:Uncharacterized protein n=1 Tax=Eimeria praecox TaxID=51316 RepID=U6G3L7_9EIME|nr:hypothetical protein, conserved [Eimeria praecox]
MSAFPDERLPVPGAHAILQNRNNQDEEGVEAHKVFTSGGPLGLVQHSKTRPFAPSLGRVIAAILTSLAAAYLVLRCFQGIAEGYRQHEATRALSAGGYDSEDQKCTSEGRGGIPQNPSYLEGEEPAYGAMYLAADDENDDEIDLSVAGEAFEELWKNRNLPPQAERIFAHYLARIVSTASLCVELKTKLKREDYFIMVNRVGKILATQLGLLSLNPPSLEPCRVRAGMALLELLSTTKVSQHDTEDVRYIGRQNRSLETLVKAIMSPRLDSAEMTGRHHQKRVVGIFRLVRAINGHMMGCISTLRYLINYPGSTLPEEEIRRQLKLLQILFETQRARCLLDSTTFWFLLCCQRNLSQFLLFSRRLAFQYCGKPISPFKEFEARLNETIESAGGTAYIPLEQDAKKEGFPGAPSRTDGPDSPSQAAADGAGAVVDAGDVADGAGAVGGDADAVFDGGAGAVFDGGAGAVFDGGAGAVYDDDGVASYPHTAFGAEQSSQMFTAGPSRTAENYAEQTTGSQWVSPRRSSTGMAAPMTTRRSFIGGHPSAAGVRGHTQQWPRHPHAAAFPTYQHPAEPAHFPEPYRGRATSYATWSPGDDRDLRELPPRFARGHDRGSKAFEAFLSLTGGGPRHMQPGALVTTET